MRYLFVVPSLTTGGAERVVALLANALKRKEVQVSILIYYGSVEKYYVESGICVYNLSGGSEKDYKSMNYVQRLHKIRLYAKNIMPDVVVPFLPQVCMQVYVALFGSRIKVAQTIRNNPWQSPKMLFTRILRNLFVFVSYKTIVQNNAQKKYFPKFLWKKIDVLPNPVMKEFLDFQWPQPDDFGVIAVGRLTKQKNFGMLIDAIEIVKNKYKSVKLYIYGEGSLRKELELYVKKRNLEENVIFKGRTENILQALSHGSIFALSSDYEGMPNSLMEAMAIGMPCVSTNCQTGPSDLICHGKNGFLVPVGDTIAMSQRILECHENKVLARMMGNNAKIFMSQNFTEEKIVNKFLNIFEGVRE